VPMFVRAGAIIPIGPDLNYVGEKPTDPITFNIYPDEQGLASMTLYEDDGVSPAYKQDGFRRTTVNAKRVGAGYVVTTGVPQGRYQPGNRRLSFVVKSAGRAARVVTVTDNASAQTIRINWDVAGKANC
jgi:alpha-glucosidase